MNRPKKFQTFKENPDIEATPEIVQYFYAKNMNKIIIHQGYNIAWFIQKINSDSGNCITVRRFMHAEMSFVFPEVFCSEASDRISLAYSLFTSKYEHFIANAPTQS